MRRKQHWLAIIGLGILAITVLSLLVSTLIEAWVYHSSGGVIALLVLIGAAVSIVLEARQLRQKEINYSEKTDWIFQGLAVIIGGLITYALAHELGLGPVIAASPPR